MSYKVRPGIVLLEICGTPVLVAKHALWKECPHVVSIPKFWGLVWKLMADGKTDEEAKEVFVKALKMPEDKFGTRIDQMCAELSKAGFLVADGDE